MSGQNIFGVRKAAPKSPCKKNLSFHHTVLDKSFKFSNFSVSAHQVPKAFANLLLLSKTVMLGEPERRERHRDFFMMQLTASSIPSVDLKLHALTFVTLDAVAASTDTFFFWTTGCTGLASGAFTKSQQNSSTMFVNNQLNKTIQYLIREFCKGI